MRRPGLRYPLTAAFLVMMPWSPRAQAPEPSLNSRDAKDHVGEVRTVCGQVIAYSCTQPYATTLTFAPASDRVPFTVFLPDADRTRFGPRPEERLLFRVICARGRIEKNESNFRMTVAAPALLNVVSEPDPPAIPFPPDAHSACEPGVTLPVVLKEVKPAYTVEAMHAGIQGAVMLRGVVGTDGTVGVMQVLRSLDPSLDLEALRAFKQWRFTPGTLAGRPAPIVITMSMSFTLRP